MNQKRNDEAFTVAPWKDEGDIFEKIRKWIFISLTVSSLLGWMGTLLNLTYSKNLTFIVITAASGIYSYLERVSPTKEYRRILYGFYGILPIFLAVMPSVVSGIAGILYEAKKTLAHHGIYLLYGGSDAGSSWNKALAMAALAFWLILLVSYSLDHGVIIRLGLMALVVYSQIRLGNENSAVWFVIWTMAFLISFVITMRAYVYVMIPIGILCLIFSLTYGLSGGEGWREQWNHLRYKDNAKVLPEGNLREAYHLQRSDQVALYVSDGNSDAYYLKGFVGNVYQNSSWNNDGAFLDDFETGIVMGNDDFLSWLHKRGYSGWNQLAQTSRLKNEKNIFVKNVNANRKYVYLPYELSTPIIDLEKGGVAVSESGEALLSQGLLGQKTYEIKSVAALGKTGVKSSDQRKDRPDEYDAYEEYLKRTCLTLPKEIKETFRNITKGNSTVGVEDPLSLVQKVRRWMKTHVRYKEEIQQIPEEQEFVSWFFDGHSEGYDVHYATIAVMLFRYYGIPSRYVEGYLFTGDKNITQKSAHAWPEIYISGRGWVPVEVMDAYEKIMPSYIEEEHILKDSSTEEKTDSQRKKDSDKQEEKKTEEKKETASTNEEEDENPTIQMKEMEEKNKQSPIVILTLTIFLALILLVVLILALREFFYRKRTLEGMSPELCITMWYELCIWLIYELETDSVEKELMHVDNRMVKWEERWTKYHPELSRNILRQVGLIRQKAIYRPKGIQWDETDQAVHFFQDEQKYLFKRLPWFKKLKVRLGIRPVFLRKKGR